MPASGDQAPGPTKGERTAQRILDVAEELFAEKGYDSTSLRQIAERAGIKQPGLYNHFAGKQALYEAVLYRALNPMAEALSRHIETASSLREYTDLPAIVTDLLHDHPRMAALFQRAMQGDGLSVGNQLVYTLLQKFFEQGLESLQTFGESTAPATGAQDTQPRATLAIDLIALFNLTIGYFLSQRAFASLTEGDLLDPENIARQKRLLHKVVRAMLVS